jgi:RHS repeat-associated protein
MKRELHAYTAYGYAATLPSTQTSLGFNSEYQEQVSALYLLGSGYRAYSTSLLRFLSPDSFSPFANGGVNAYCYCGGDPINNLDPSGHFNVRYLAQRRAQQKRGSSRQQLLLRLDSPTQVNSPSKRDAPPYLTSHPDAFSTQVKPPPYNPGKLPSYSERLPNGHHRIITPVLSEHGEFVQLPKLPAYEKIAIRPKKTEAIPQNQVDAYRSRLEEVNGRYQRLRQVVRRLERGNMYIPDEYRQNIQDLRGERDFIRDVLRN